MTHAHYAAMGGFAVDIGHLHNTMDRGTLTPNGLLFLADQGYFFELPPETIADKSKANLLAKALVCLQDGLQVKLLRERLQDIPSAFSSFIL